MYFFHIFHGLTAAACNDQFLIRLHLPERFDQVVRPLLRYDPRQKQKITVLL